MMRRILLSVFTLVGVRGWMVPMPSSRQNLVAQQRQRQNFQFTRTSVVRRKAEGEEDDVSTERTSFDQAGKNLIDEEDQKRLEEMGDFDAIDGQEDSIKQMREAIRQRTSGLGIEKSKVSADYIAQKEAAAKSSGPGGAVDDNMFGGLDLSQISDTKLKETGKTDWSDDQPSILFDPEKELTKEEQDEIDPVGTKNLFEQFTNEISESELPSITSALTSVGLMVVVFAVSCGIIVFWDGFLNDLYTNNGLLPTREEMANYAARFDGLDLPEGWMDGLGEADAQSLAEKVNSNIPTTINVPPIETKGGLPDL